MIKRSLQTATLLAVISICSVAQSIPKLISYSGVVTGAAGKPVSGLVSITFSL